MFCTECPKIKGLLERPDKVQKLGFSAIGDQRAYTSFLHLGPHLHANPLDKHIAYSIC